MFGLGNHLSAKIAEDKTYEPCEEDNEAVARTVFAEPDAVDP